MPQTVFEKLGNIGGFFSAEVACYTCGEFLCPDCSEKHGSLRATKDHETCEMSELSVGENLVKFQRERFEACSNHGDMKKLYCNRCEVDLCNVCVYEDGHQKHDVTSIHNKVIFLSMGLFSRFFSGLQN